MKKKDCVIYYTDDDEDDRDMFEEAFKAVSEDCEIVTQRDGDELLDMLNSPPPLPSIVFLDLNMPIKNGYQVLQEIRGKEQMSNLPVIIFSTSDNAEAITESQKLGANLYIQKPSDFTSMKRILREILSLNWTQYFTSPHNFVFKLS